MAPPPLTAESLLRHAAFVRSVARATLKGDDLVDDAVQDTFVAALEDSATRKGALKPWLGGVARRKAALLIRGRAASRRREARVARPDRVDDVAETAARAETGRRLIDAVLDLAEPYRGVILLRFYEGLPPREVAKRLDIPVETVRTRVKRGLHRLRSVLEERDGRGWRAALLPLAAPHLAQAGAAGVTVGSWIVSKKLLAVAACLLVLIGAAVWSWHGGATADGNGDPAAGVEGTELAAAAERTEAAPALIGGTPREVVAAYPKADRDRDIHGIVVDAGGAPLAGAKIRTFTLSWQRANLQPDLTRWTEEQGGPRTTSAADGSFVIRVPRHSRWNLRVTADGFANKALSLVRAGERVRVVMDAGVSVTARVLDADGKPLPGVRVVVIRTPGQGDVYVAEQALTDANGAADLGRIPGGYRLRVYATHPGHGAIMTKHAVPKLRDTTIELQMSAGRTVAGVVTDQQKGEPVAGARVGFMWAFLVETQTDAQGRYELGGWAEHLGLVHVAAQGYVRQETEVLPSGDIDVELVPSGTVKGRVLSAEGTPLGNVPVAGFAAQRGGRDQRMSTAFVYTQVDGTFALSGLRSYMPHTLHVLAPGSARLRHPFTLSTEDAVTNLGDLQLAAPSAITGTLRDTNGDPIARRMVRLGSPKSPMGDTYGVREEAFTDDLGRFGFADLAEGSYVLTIGETQLRRTVDLAIGATVNTLFEVSSAREHRVVVVDADGRPVRNIEVTFNGPNKTLGTAKTDGAGTIALDAGAEPTHINVSLTKAQKREYLFIQQVKWPLGQAELRIVLKAGKAITGRLVGADGSAYPYAFVNAVRKGKNINTAWTNEQGEFLFQLPAGEPVDLVMDGQVQTKHPEHDGLMNVEQKPVEGRVNGVEPGTTDVTIQLRAIATDRSVTLRVTDVDGQPLAGALVQLSYQKERRQTDAGGRITFENLQARATGFSIQGPFGGSFDSKNVNVVPNGQEVVVVLQEMLPIHGKVRLPDDVPAVGAQIDPQIPGVISSIKTDDKGEFWLFLVPDQLPVVIRATYADKSGSKYEGDFKIVDRKSLPVIIQIAPTSK